MDLTRLGNKKVKEAAAKVAKHVKHIDAGLLQAQRLGIRGISALVADRDLFKVIKLADDNGDADMLKTFASALTFKGKKSVREWTTQDGRNRARAVQLYKALEGDGSYASIKRNIQALPTGEKELRALARDEGLLQSFDKASYVDENKLLKTLEGGKLQIKDVHREWYLDQASLMEAFRKLEGKDPDLQRRLALAMMHSFSKAAALGERAEELELQTTPFYNLAGTYHRSAPDHKMLEKLWTDVCANVGVTPGSMEMVHNPTFREQIHRQFAFEDVDLVIDSEDKFGRSCDKLLAHVKAGRAPKAYVVFDVSGLWAQANVPLSGLRTTFSARLESILLAKVKALKDELDAPPPPPPEEDLEAEQEAPPEPAAEKPPEPLAEKPPPPPEPKYGLEWLQIVAFATVPLRPLGAPPPQVPLVLPQNGLDHALEEVQDAPEAHPPVKECEFVKQLREREPPKNVVTPELADQAPAADPSINDVHLMLMPPFLSSVKDPPEELKKILKGSAFDSKHTEFVKEIRGAMIHTGYRQDPIQAKRTWLQAKDAKTILGLQGIQLTEFATPEKQAIVCKSWEAFCKTKTFADFEDLANEKTVPYLTILPAATAALLKGLNDYVFDEKPRTVKVKAKVKQSLGAPAWTANGTVSVSAGQAELFADEKCTTALQPLSAGALGREVEFYVRAKPSGGVKIKLTLDDPKTPQLEVAEPAGIEPFAALRAQAPGEGSGVDKLFRSRGIIDLLQTAYFRMLNAMGTAVHQRHDLKQFWNAIEVIHQELFNVLSVVEPHADGDFEIALRAALASGSMVPGGVEEAKCWAKPSSMHTLSNILSAVEAQKGTNKLNVCVLVDNYYEGAVFLIPTHRTYQVVQLAGDDTRDAQGRDVELPQDDFIERTPLDLFVADFHHNISLYRTHYVVENLTHQVDELYRLGFVADKFTVAIDCTVDLIHSSDVKAFLEHNKARITQGKLNVVLYRSAQKFDMLGMDNYYGGYASALNKGDAFKKFNDRMGIAGDQLDGIFRQGLTHLVKYAAAFLDQYRLGLMAGTKKLYDALPPSMIWSKDCDLPIQVSRVDDPRGVFLDFKFPRLYGGPPQKGDAEMPVFDAFQERLDELAKKEELPLTKRPSFGFPTTNLTKIDVAWRINPGLETDAVRARYTALLTALHTTATAALAEGRRQGKNGKELMDSVAAAMRSMALPK